MAFDLNAWARQSDSMNTTRDTTAGGLAMYTYRSSVDNGAAVAGANYFANQVNDLFVGDLIFAEASDGFTSLQVAALDKDAGTITTSSTGLTSVIGTANLADNAVTSPKLDVGVLQLVEVAVNSAEIIGMSAAPKLILAAAGAGTYLLVDILTIQYNYGGTQFTAGGEIQLQYGNTVLNGGQQAAVGIGAAAFNGFTASQVSQLSGFLGTAADAAVDNLGLFLGNAAAPFATGDGDLLVKVWYRQIAI